MTPNEVQLSFFFPPKISSLIHISHDSVGLPVWEEAGKCSLLMPGLLPRINWWWWEKEIEGTTCYSGKFSAPPGD